MNQKQHIEKLEKAKRIILEVANEYEDYGEAKFLKEIITKLDQQIKYFKEATNSNDSTTL